MAGTLEESKRPSVLSLSEFTNMCDEEYVRRAEKLAIVENELEEKSLIRDVVLSVRMSVDSEERREVGSNMAMLSLVSDYFHALFQGDSSLRRGETIELSAKLTLEGMSAINALAFGVLSKVQVSRDNLAHLMAAAEYCEVPALSQLCDEFVRRHGIYKDVTLACTLLTDLDHLGFASKVDDYLDQMPPHCLRMIFLHQSAMRMSVDLFSSILKSDNLALSEDKIWYQCVRWAKNQIFHQRGSDLLTHLIKLKPFIRFPQMTEKFLMIQVEPTKLLNSDEFLGVFLMRNGRLSHSSLFCDAAVRRKDPVWDEQSILAKYHRIYEGGSLLIHVGKSNWSSAFVSRVIHCEGTTEIEFEHLSDKTETMFGVLQESEKPTAGQYFGYPLEGVGYSGKGYLYKPYNSSSQFGRKISKGDRLKLTVVFSDPFHATLDFYQNGIHMGHSVQLDPKLDVSHGLKFAVQTYQPGTKIRISELLPSDFLSYALKC